MKAESEEAEEEELDEFGEPIRSKSQVSSGPWKTATEPEVKGKLCHFNYVLLVKCWYLYAWLRTCTIQDFS